MNNKIKQDGFTFVELLLVVAIIAILAGALITVIDPAKHFRSNRDAQRKNDTHAILNAVFNYYTDNNGTLPAAINTSTDCFIGAAIAEICRTGAGDCTGLVDLSVLTLNEAYLSAIPTDPQSTSTNGTDYNIVKSAKQRITICAPDGETISRGIYGGWQNTIIISVVLKNGVQNSVSIIFTLSISITPKVFSWINNGY